MSFWSMMNWVAWGLCGVMFVIIAQDFIRVELGLMAEKEALKQASEKTMPLLEETFQ